jgi:hypothetical protein
MSKEKHNNISLIQLSNYVKPEVKESYGRKWVLNGDKNWFFKYIIDRYNGSPTNESIINVFCRMIYGKGIAINGKNEVYDELNKIFPKREQKKCISDFKMFGQYAMQIVRSKGQGVAQIAHLPMDKLGMEKANEQGDIDNVYYCEDWDNTYKYKPELIPIFKGKMTAPIMVKVVQPYSPGHFYYSDPDYMAGLQYCELEEEIANFCVNHIKSGLSFGYIINFNNGGSLEPEQKDEIEYMIKQKLTGSSNAGKFILSFNDGKEAEVSVVNLEVNDAHSQWEFLSKESSMKIVTAHGAFPNLFGIATSSGLGNNADELDVQSKLVQDYQIYPKQSTFIDELASILELAGLETDLAFIPLRDTYKSVEASQEVAKTEPVDDTIDVEEDSEEDMKLSANISNVEILLKKGEDINYDEWDLVDDRRCDEMTLKENDLNTVFEFASVPKTSDKKSVQDTSLFKIHYRYAGKRSFNAKGEDVTRDFCDKMLKSNKLFRADDLNDNYTYNETFSPEGEKLKGYNIFNFKGGTNCQHWFQRVIFLKKGNDKISVNEARRMILALEPEDRASAKWVANDKKVAQVAEKQNNYWSLKPNYRNSGVTPIKD